MKNFNHKFLLVAILIITGITGCEKELYVDDSGNLVPRTVDEDPDLPSISINGALLHSEAFGPVDGNLIVVLHGGPGSDYRHLLRCREFGAHGYRVVFYDQRGSGLSQRFPKSAYSMEVMLDDLTGVIDHYRTSPLQKVFLLGQSWGAMLATAYVNEYPEAISGMILGEPGGLIWDDVVDYVRRTREAGITSEILNDITYMDQFITVKRSEHEILDYKYGLLAFAELDEDNVIGNEDLSPFWRGGAVCNQAMFEIGNREEPDWTTNLDEYKTEVLFMYSERNRAYGKGWAERVSAPFKSVQLFEVADAGHDMLTFEKGWNNSFPVMLSYLNSLK